MSVQAGCNTVIFGDKLAESVQYQECMCDGKCSCDALYDEKEEIIMESTTMLPKVRELKKRAWTSHEKDVLALRHLEQHDRRKGKIELAEDALKRNWTYWNKQPVWKLGDVVSRRSIGKIEELEDKNSQPAILNALRQGKEIKYYKWYNTWTNSEAAEVCTIEYTAYNKVWSSEYLDWWFGVGRPIRVGIRDKTDQLVGLLAGRVVEMRIGNEIQTVAEAGIMYVAPKFRHKSLAKSLMNEFRRQTVRLGVQTGFFVNDCIVPSPIATWNTVVRELNVEKLQDIIPMDAKDSLEEKVKMLQLIQTEFATVGFRRMEERDLDSVVSLYNESNCSAFISYQSRDRARREFLHHLVQTYVVEGENDQILDLVSLVPYQWQLKTPYSTYASGPVKVMRVHAQLLTSDMPIVRIINDVLLAMTHENADLVEHEAIGDTNLFADTLRFVPHGYSRFLNLYNYAYPSLSKGEVGHYSAF